METMLGTARRGHPGLYWMAVAMAALAAAILVAAAFDHRVLLGAPLWFKPLKFAISFVAYGLTLAWMLGRLPTPALQRTGWILVAGSVTEVVIIVVQAARGVRSHFNDDGGSGTLLFSIMGATVVVIYLLTAVIAVRFLRERSLERDLAVAVRLGLGVSLVGMAVGYLMIANGGHAVGVADGGPGLPLVGWSTTGGDLRIGHFVGMHALQALPLLVAALARWAPWLDVSTRVRAALVVAVGYVGLIAVLTWQALRAQPVLDPDPATVAALLVVLLGTAIGLRTVIGSRAAVTAHEGRP